MGIFDFLPGEPTYEAVERRRALANALGMQAVGAQPATFGQGLSAIGAALGGALANRGAERMDTRRAAIGDAAFEAALNGMPQDNSPLAAALGGSFSPPAGMAEPANTLAASSSYGITPGAANGAAGPEVRQPFASGTYGLPASLVQTESGGNWQALNSEGYGGRGQFGADRLADAARAGVIPAGMTGADYARAPEDVQIRVENWHRNDILNRLGQYVGTDVDGPGPIPPLTPDSILAVAHLGGTGGAQKFIETGGRYNPADSNGTSLADYAIRHAGGATAAAAPGMAPMSMPAPPPVNVALIRAMNNPYMTPEQKQILGGIYQQQLAMQITPYQQAQLQMAQQEHALRMQQAMAPEPVRGSVIGQRLVNPQTGEVMADFTAETQAGFRQATPEEAAAYGAPGGQFGPDGRFYPINPPSGFAVETGPDGQVRVVQGSGASGAAGKPFTEGQSKDVVFATRAKGALEAFEPYAEALTSRGERIAEGVPLGLGRGMQTPEFQMAKNAGDEFLQAILRKDTGAAITEQEQALYGVTYLPQPGDLPEVLEYKRAARQRAVAAIEGGMSPAQIVAQEMALARTAVPDVTPATATPSRDFKAIPRADLLAIDPETLSDADLDAYLEALE